ncbi:MAG TPA: MDR family MFS transporter, partial [Candidatus Saccharimonadales bacterium]|nr:MDR family MFS transporter [Candidatus Saccharimonadales bacterium]
MLANIPTRRKLLVMLGVMLALFLAALDQTIVATALPRIVQDFHGLEHLSWVIAAYLLASTVVVPIYGKLSDLYGRKPFILSAIVLFLIGSVLSGLSRNMLELVIFRAIQGLGGGAIFANAFAVVGDLYPPAERGRWQGLLGGVFGLSSIIGPTLGGWLTDHASWRWNFFINIPVGIVAFVAVGALLPHIDPDRKERSIDYAGALLLTGSLVSLLLGLIWGGTQYPWSSPVILGLLGGSAVGFLGFGLVERRAADPVLPLSLFQNPIFSVSIAALFFVGIGMFGSIVFIPLFAQLVLGADATHSGTILTPLTLAFVASSVFSGQVVSRTGRYKAIAVGGLALATVALFVMSRMTAETTAGSLIARMVATGLGIGATMPVFTLAVQNAFGHEKLGIATASTQLFRSIGATVGTAVLGSVLNLRLAREMGSIASDPFLRVAASVQPGFHIDRVDANSMQAILTQPMRGALE